MNAKKFAQMYGYAEARRVAEQAGTSIQYFYQLANGHRIPSRQMAARLEQASGGKLTRMDLLYPEQGEDNTHV